VIVSKPIRHIADDLQRGALMRAAVQKAAELARGDFYHGLMVEGLDDESLALVARADWETFSTFVQFDYSQFAQALFLQAYQTAYHAHLRDLVDGRQPPIADLAAVIEAEIDLQHGLRSGKA
jgi:hypothetical protein